MLAYNLTTPPPVAAMFLRAPVRMPSPRALVEAETARLIDVLDAMEPDADIEQDAGEEAEGSWPYGTTDDDEEGGDDEPSLCGTTVSSGSWDDRENDTSDFEPSLGSVGSTFAGTTRFAMTVNGRTYNPADQTRWASGPRDDREEENEHGGDIQDEPHDEDTDREPDVDDEPDNEDKGAEEDEGPPGYYFRDRTLVEAANAARGQLREIQDRRRRAPRGELRMVSITGPDGGAYVLRGL